MTGVIDLEREPIRESARAPAKVWFNWWRVEGPCWHIPSRSVPPIGAHHRDPKPFPSYELAEQAAIEDKSVADSVNVAWAGAYPEGERP